LKAMETMQPHEHDHNPKTFKIWFWISLALTIPAFYFSPTWRQILSYRAIDFPYAGYLPAAIGLALVSSGGLVFFKGAIQELKRKKPAMMSLIAMALVVAAGYSLYVNVAQLLGFAGMAMDFWWELTSLVTIMLLGHWVEMASVGRAKSSMKNLVALLPQEAELVSGKSTEKVQFADLRVGDIVLVRPGASVPADGIVVQGSSRVDEALVTGESAPIEKSEGDLVIGGTVNSSNAKRSQGALTVRITAVGSDTLVAGVMRLVAEAQAFKSKGQLLAEKAAGWLFYVALSSALITGGLWLILGTQPLDFTIERVVGVLVVACPHALGLAIPLVTSISSARAARAGLIIKNRADFEAARAVEVVLFDKTGTLTIGKRTLLESSLAIGSPLASVDELLQLAAAVEIKSEHVLGEAIVEAAKIKAVPLPDASNFESTAGRGVSALVGASTVQVGSPALLAMNNIQIQAADLFAVAEANERANTVVYVVIDGRFAGFFEFGDEVRASGAQAVYELQRRGIRVAMVTGDATGVANAVAKQLNIDEVFAEILPARKAEIVKQLQADGSRVAFVGDGINDAPALAQADVGLAVGSGTAVALESAGLIMVNSDPTAIVSAIKLSAQSVSKVRQNLWWAAGYNLIAIPLAAGAFAFVGLELTPALCAVLMSLSTVIVAANAQLLRR
jgi:Cu2+-exporting ATPase